MPNALTLKIKLIWAAYILAFLPAFATISLLVIFNSSRPAYAEETTSTQVIYDETLSNGWSNWSWKTSLTWNNRNPKTSGKNSIKVVSKAWGGFYLHSDTNIRLENFTNLTFDFYATNKKQKFLLTFYGKNNTPLKQIPFDQIKPYDDDSWQTYEIVLSDHNLEDEEISGFSIQEAASVDKIKYYVDQVKLIKKPTSNPTLPIELEPVENPDITPTVTPTPTPTPSPTPAPIVPIRGYSTSNGSIYLSGQEIDLRGVNWFGFEENNTKVVHGLWKRNYKDMISQIKSLGFNAVRLPFCPSVLDGASVASIDYSKNEDLRGLNSLEVLDKIMAELNNQELYVLLDHHRPDCVAISELWTINGYSENDWINDLKFVANRYKNLQYLMGIDLKNEPHKSATWGTGNTSTDWNTAAERAGKEILSVNPNVLIFIEGIQENKDSQCSSFGGHWMGGNLEPQTCNPISTDAIPANKLVFSPHVYGPDVYYQSYFSASNFPENMPAIWEKHFGFLVSQGYTVVPGEWGGKYGNGGDAKDKVWQDAIAKYFSDNNICSSFYWSFNPNSGDTGGILQDDWQNVWQNKMDMLKNYFANCN